MTRLMAFALIVSFAGLAEAQTDQSAPEPRWQAELSLMNAFDGNINHDPVPLRSFGVAPGAALRYQSPVFAWGYDIALNNYTGTDEWDRVSHGLFATATHRAGRFRFETSGSATWKGSSEDRELADEFAVSERVVLKATNATRFVLFGAYRYKHYPDDPETSGPSPYVGGKLDRRFGDRRLTVGYKYQTRHSQAVRDRYWRHAYSLSYSTPVDLSDDELLLEVEFRPQRYQRLIKVADSRVIREDRRLVLSAAYDRPLSARVRIVWLAALEARTSNDREKRYTAPSLAMTLRYRWR